jgi:hypothetical protein
MTRDMYEEDLAFHGFGRLLGHRHLLRRNSQPARKLDGSWNSYGEANGHPILSNGTINMAITDQKDRIFAGNLTVKFQNETMSNGFAGAIGLDNKTFYLSEFEKGYALGTIVSSNEIEYVYLADGENGSEAIDKLHRV